MLLMSFVSLQLQIGWRMSVTAVGHMTAVTAVGHRTNLSFDPTVCGNMTEDYTKVGRRKERERG